MPKDRRNRFKKNHLLKAMELTHAFAPPQGIGARSVTVVAGDFNMPIDLVDSALRETHGVTWQVSDNGGNRDFMFAADGVDLNKIEAAKPWVNFEKVHDLVAASMVLRPPEPAPGPGASASSRGTEMEPEVAVFAARERREAAKRILKFMVKKKQERKAAQEAKDQDQEGGARRRRRRRRRSPRWGAGRSH